MNEDTTSIEQRTEEWIQSRLGKATSSRFADIMAKGRGGSESVSRRNYRSQLVSERLTHVKAESYTSTYMQRGIDYEATARLAYEFRSGNIVEETGFYTHEKLDAGASPDGLVGDNGLLEIKVPAVSTHIETLKKQQLPTQYYWQVMGQMWITGRDWCDFVSYCPDLPENAQLFITRIDRDDNAIKMLMDEVTKFLREVEAEVKFIENYKGGE